MQLGDVFGIVAASISMFLVLSVLHIGDIKQAVAKKMDVLEKENVQQVEYKGNHPGLEKKSYTLAEIKSMQPERQNEILGTNAGFGGEKISAPQASLMAVVAKSIIQKRTEWILIIVGMFMGLALILMQIKSPMLVSVGMYLPIDTSFAIFLGGVFKGMVDHVCEKKKIVDAEKEKINNTGTLLASGLIAGEALIGIVFAAMAFGEIHLLQVFEKPSYLLSILGMGLLGAFLVVTSLKKTGGDRT